jgi:hypothetical protein
MDASSFLKRTIMIALVSVLPAFVSVASPGGGGHSSSGSGGGHSSGGSSVGHSSSGANGGHSSVGASSSHSSSSTNSSHSSSVSKGGHPADPSTGPGAVVGGRSVSGSSVRSSAVRTKAVPVVNVQHFGSGYGHGDVSGDDYLWQSHHRHHRYLFGFIPIGSPD